METPAAYQQDAASDPTMEGAYFLTAPIELRAAQPGEPPTQFSGTAYSGAVIDDWGERIIIDLATTRTANFMPLLHEHRREQTIGIIQQAEITDTALSVSGELLADIDDTAKTIATKAARGLRYQMSVGLYQAKGQFVPEDHSVTINGSQHQGPLVVLTGGLVREVSIVTLGADANTNAAFFSANAGQYTPQGKTKATAPLTQESPTMSDAPDLQAQVDALSAQVADLTSALDAAKTEAETAKQTLADLTLSARKRDVQALFSELGRELTEDSAAHYLSLSDDAFAAISADLRASKPKAPAHLFSEQATGEPLESKPLINTQAIYDNRRNA
jgi:hypothetical protein